MKIEDLPHGPLTCWPANHDDIEEAIFLLMARQAPCSLLLIFTGKNMECLVRSDEQIVKGVFYQTWEVTSFSSGQSSNTIRLSGYTRPRIIAKECYRLTCAHHHRVYKEAMEALRELGE